MLKGCTQVTKIWPRRVSHKGIPLGIHTSTQCLAALDPASKTLPCAGPCGRSEKISLSLDALGF